MRTRQLGTADREAAVALWHAAELTRPWNDPADDFNRAIAGATSTVMAGHDGHRGWVYYLAVDPTARGRGFGTALASVGTGWRRGKLRHEPRDIDEVPTLVSSTDGAIAMTKESLMIELVR